MTVALVSGFLLGLSFILVIGAQNAFVIRQGIRGEHILPVCVACALSDAALIAIGVAGFGAFVATYPVFEEVMRLGGAVFLFAYGAKSMLKSIEGNHYDATDTPIEVGLWPTLVTVLALTWLNPHVYLDTVVLLGTISTTYGANAFAFGVGACLASLVFFFALGYGAALLRPVFANTVAWRILDFLIAVVMWAIAFQLINQSI